MMNPHSIVASISRFHKIYAWMVLIIERYKDHLSINLIKSKKSCLANTFSFTPVSIEEVKRAIESLDPKKAAQEKDIHTNIL